MKKKKKKRIITINMNFKLSVCCLIGIFLVIIGTLSYVCLSPNVDGIDLTVFANNRNTTKEPLYATRGIIYDKYGKALAKNANSYKVIAFLSPSRTSDMTKPNHVVDKDKTAKELCSVLAKEEKDKDKCIKTLTSYLKQDLYQVELGSWGKVSEDEKRALEELHLPGIGFETLAKKRQYINSSWASYILGYARNDDNDEITGEMGIEAYYDEELKGVDGFLEYQKDAYGYKMANTPENRVEAQSGSDIYLTINSDVQNVLENTIANFSKDKELEWAIFTVMDAKTGEIIGSATNPSFNPNNLNDLKSYLNPLVSYQYEPGSTMKIFSWMAAMEEGIYKGDENYLSGTLKLSDDTVIKDFNNVGWGTINYNTGFAYSSNVAATNLAMKLGVSKLSDYYNVCGFGKKTGVTLPGELSGKVDFLYESELANASFGQGVLVTPIQLLSALSAIANDGVMVKPQIVSKIVDNNGKATYELKTTYKNKIASTKTVNEIKKLMYNVVYEGFSYNLVYAPSDVKIMGKTGTAQIASPSGGYLTGEYDYIKSFLGAFPYEEPEYVFYFATKKYVGDGTTIAKTVATAISDVANVVNVSTTKNDVDESKIISMPNYINMGIDSVKEDIKKKNLTGLILGDGKSVIGQYPSQDSKVIDKSKVYILTNSKNIKMIDITGFSVNEVIRFCNFIGLKYKINGVGKVVNYSIKKDTLLDLNKMILEVNLG